MYFNIQRFSTHDGDGIRSILFLKGCTLACPWCQNPESRSSKQSLLFDPALCLNNCSLCQKASNSIIRNKDNKIEIDRLNINKEDLIKLTDCCPTKALSVCGKDGEVDKLCEELLKDKAFFIESNGGVTFSGGEPLMQSELVADIAKRLQMEGVNTAIETCLHTPWKNIEAVLPYIDCWLTDLKHDDLDKFNSWTNGSLTRIKKNLIKLAKVSKRLIIRLPIVPSFNDTEEELKRIIDFVVSLETCSELHLIPYHILGIGKYNLLDLSYNCSLQPLNKPKLLENIKQYAKNHPLCTYPLTVTIRG